MPTDERVRTEWQHECEGNPSTQVEPRCNSQQTAQ